MKISIVSFYADFADVFNELLKTDIEPIIIFPLSSGALLKDFDQRVDLIRHLFRFGLAKMNISLTKPRSTLNQI